MGEVRAFVGHSFTDDDKVVVGQFIEFFNTLAKFNSSFSWVHARAAETKQLAEKVSALIQDKNHFIGICTKKERILHNGRASRLFSNLLIFNSQELQWKTSDWVIQEIGLAIGRNMHLILLIEEGVRKPGALQGDVEYINFTRQAPERSFTRIAEMVTALGVNQSATTSNLLASTTAPPPPAKAETETTADAPITPELNWTDDDYAHAQFRCVVQENALIEGLKEAYLKLPGEPRETRLSIWEARNESYQLLFRKGGDLERLRTLAESHAENLTIKRLYARALELFDKHETAAELFDEVAAKVGDDDERARSLANAALSYERAGASAKASAILRDLGVLAANDVKRSKRLYATMRDLAGLRKDNYLSLAALEGEINQSPAAFRTRFSLAYLHSEVGNYDLALHHYLQILPHDRKAMDWNNLGAAYHHLKINGRAIAAFRNAEEMGETLAMANLGYSLLQAGFVDEAKSICAKALAIEGFHKNVGQLSTAILENDGTETKTVNSTLDEAKPRIAFYKLFGVALALPEPTGSANAWTGPDCEMTLDIMGDQVRFYGCFERSGNSLPVAMLGQSISRRPVRHEIEYTGVLRGRTVIGKIKRSSDEQPSGNFLSSAGEPEGFLMVISEDEILALDLSYAAAKPVSFRRHEAPVQLPSQ
jgi:tetratricopeptide (TPR) repeat protein